MRQVLEHVGGKFEEAPANSRFAGGRCFTLYNRQAIARVRYSRDGADKFEIVRQIAPRLIATCEIFRGSTERESMACHIRVLGPRLPDNFLITELQKLSDNPTGSEVFEVLAKLSSQPRAIDATCSTKTGELVSSGITTPMTIIPEELKRLGAENKLTSGEIEIVLKEDLESSFSDKIADKDKAKQLAERIFGGIIFHFLPQI